MALLTAEDQAEIKKIFEQLTGDVRLEFYTQRASALYVPGREECATCKDAQTLLEEVVALSDKLHLEIHEISPGDDGIERVPALIMTADGVKGKVRYFGLPSGYEFSVLLGSLIDVSKAEAGLAEDTIKMLDGLEKDLHLQVFVTPS